MERPRLNPLFMEDAGQPAPPKPSLARRSLRGLWTRIGKVLLTDLRFWRAAHLSVEDAPPWQRVARALFYRLLFVPALLALVIGGLVWTGTHPPRAPVTADPLSIGIYYDLVNFVSADGTRLEGWLVPVLDAKTVLKNKEQVLLKKQPAIVLAHDFGSGQIQMLPLVAPLHEAGYVLLVVSLRGSAGESAGSTFGLREADDVQAAVELLSRRPDIDAQRIAVLGIGTGASAAVLAAERVPSIAALVLDRPVDDIDGLIRQNIALPQPWLAWLQPTYKWAFELGYRVDCEDINLRQRAKAIESRRALIFNAGSGAGSVHQSRGMTQTIAFLENALAEKQPPALATTQEPEN